MELPSLHRPLAVIRSCQNPYQLDPALRYCELWLAKQGLPTRGMVFARFNRESALALQRMFFSYGSRSRPGKQAGENPVGDKAQDGDRQPRRDEPEIDSQLT